MKSNQITLWKPAVLGFTILCLVIAMTLAVSPSARASLTEAIKTIGGMVFTETDQYPGGSEQAEIFPEETMSLESARAELPFTFELPARVPEGFVMDENAVTVLNSSKFTLSYVQIAWHKPAAGIPADQPDQAWYGLHLRVEYQEGASNTGGVAAGLDSVKEVQINGLPGALVRGAWNAQTHAYELNDLLTLRWEKDGLTYNLSTSDKAVSEEELLKVAESIP